MKYNDKMYLICAVMFFASLLGCFFAKAEDMWYPVSHLIISAVGIIAIVICSISDNR